MSRFTVTFTVRSASAAESWVTRQGTVTKSTVRVAKGQKGGGQFHGATNLRGTVKA